MIKEYDPEARFLTVREQPFAPAEARDEDGAQITWTHWVPCPTNDDPILISVLT